MDNGGHVNNKSTDVITLMQVSRSISDSSISSDQSKSVVAIQENWRNLTNHIVIAKWRRTLGEIEWNKYIRWKLLLVFGFTLWSALCIGDSLYPRPIYIMRDKKELPRQASTDNSSTTHLRDLFKTNFCEALEFLFFIFIGFFLYAENQMARKWWDPSEDSREIHCDSLAPVYHEKDFLFDDFDDSTDLYNNLEYPEEKNCVKVIEGRKLYIHPGLYWHWKLFQGIAEVTTKIKRKSKRFDKLGMHNSQDANCYLIKCNLKEKACNTLDVTSYETYDQEIQRFIEANKNQSTTAFEDVLHFCKNSKNHWPSKNQGKIHSGMIISSPDFQAFLARYKIPAITPNSCKRLTF